MGLLQKAAKDFAKGLPDKEDIHTLPKNIRGNWSLARQIHFADRAGKHEDLRLCRGKNAYSFAMRGGLPKRGEKKLAVAQPLHRASYATWSGVIESGYGKGTVKALPSVPIKVVESTDKKFKFEIPKKKTSEQYALIHMNGNNWLLLNHTKKGTTHAE